MRCFAFVMCACFFYGVLSAATVPEPVWPSWVGVSKGGDVSTTDIGYDQDDHDNYDCGSDSWGWWANAEVKSGGVVVATVEMRYIPQLTADYGKGPLTGGLFKIGAPSNEQGAMPVEFPRTLVPAAKINGSKAFWICADEVTQDVWEKVMGVVLQKKAKDNSDINAVNTVAASGLKTLRAVECQTLPSVRTFCTTFQGLAGVTKTVRIPTEAEWEYACRANTATAFWTGRILDGIFDAGFSGSNVSHSGMMYDYNAADMDAKAASAPNGDSGLTPPWEYQVTSVDGDGLARNWGNHPLTIRIGGKLTLSGGALNLQVAALFDDRYQHRYIADHYGAYTPILMLYKYDSTTARYEPRPYGDPTASDMYYRFLELKDSVDKHNPINYVKCTDLNINTGKQRRYIPGNYSRKNAAQIQAEIDDEFNVHVGNQPGDWYTNGGTDPLQLEYREMVYVSTRFNATGVEVPDGQFIKDFDGRRYPIRSMYTPAPYWEDGQKRSETLPTTNVDIAAFARGVDQNAPGDPAMNTDEYVEAVANALAAYWDKRDIPNTFYTGPFTGIVKFQAVGAGEILHAITDEIQVEINGVDVTIGPLGRNPWGLYNMHGNLEEWTETRWDGRSDYKDFNNATGNYNTGAYNVSRGGSWRTGADRCRSAARTARDPNRGYDDLGFRFIIEE